MRCLKKTIKGFREEKGQVMLLTLAFFTLSTLLIAPFLDFVSTNLKAEKLNEKNVSGYYAAESGVEDGLWRMKYSPPVSFPYSYQLSVNGMTVTVTIDQITEIAGESVGAAGIHGGWLSITNDVDYSSGIYDYSMLIDDNGSGTMKCEKILVALPPGLTYVDDSTGGDITSSDPEIVGTADYGIIVFWDIPSPYPTISSSGSDHYFQLSGAEGIQEVEGHGFVRASRADVGTVWDADSKPYSIQAQARNSSNELVTTIRAGLWKGTSGYMEVSCWRVND